MVFSYPPQGNLAPVIEFAEIEEATVILESEGIASNDNDVTLPTSAAVKDYSDTTSVSTTLTDGNILVGNGSNVATSVNPTGDIDITNTGVFSISSAVILNADVNACAAIDYSKLATLTDGNLLVGSCANVATSVNPSGDVDISNTGVFSIASGVIINADVSASAAITYAKLQDVSATNVLLGRDSACAGVIEEISAANVRTILNVECGSTADQTDAQIKTAYENNACTNEFSDAEQTKLSGIETSADVTDTTNVNTAAATIVGTIATGQWCGTAITSANLDADTAHLGCAQTFDGAKTFSSVLTMSGGVNVVMGDGDITGINNTQTTVEVTTTEIDFAESDFQTISISGNTTFTGVNYVAGKNKRVYITTDSTLRTLTFPSSWKFMGAKPADQAASKVGVLSLDSSGTDEASVRAAYAVEA